MCQANAPENPTGDTVDSVIHGSHDAMQRQHARAHRLPGHLAAQLGAAAQQECG